MGGLTLSICMRFSLIYDGFNHRGHGVRRGGLR